ncbi:conserved protein of unknown function [Ectopseudomonas oleovorans]|uniref:Uncharacterized protein n=1 Tax=Ectopseudomonas oleovorans TaxID=301 RepID=A0A653BCL0_ECTOL|nr:conserved protein of unknown function [Pseudomonas oleovorans]
MGLPVSLTTCQYFGGRLDGVCFSQYEAAVTQIRPSTTRHCAGRHSVQGVDEEAAGLGGSQFRLSQQTEQSQLPGCG